MSETAERQIGPSKAIPSPSPDLDPETANEAYRLAMKLKFWRLGVLQTVNSPYGVEHQLGKKEVHHRGINERIPVERHLDILAEEAQVELERFEAAGGDLAVRAFNWQEYRQAGGVMEFGEYLDAGQGISYAGEIPGQSRQPQFPALNA